MKRLFKGRISTNLQGDIIELVDVNGNIVVQYRYDT
jgi:hypothetical protein